MGSFKEEGVGAHGTGGTRNRQRLVAICRGKAQRGRMSQGITGDQRPAGVEPGVHEGKYSRAEWGAFGAGVEARSETGNVLGLSGGQGFLTSGIKLQFSTRGEFAPPAPHQGHIWQSLEILLLVRTGVR